MIDPQTQATHRRRSFLPRRPWVAVAALACVIGTGCAQITEVAPDPAPPGAAVTITGSGFGATQGGGSVLYDGAALAVVSWADTAIVATLPAAKPDATYTVTVVTALGSASIAHTIVNLPGDMVAVPAGTFPMGSSTGYAAEAPVHDVDLGGFYLDRDEVVVDDYARCVSAGACTPPATYPYCNWGVAGHGNHPVNCVTWDQAAAYCGWNGRRLPTEAEWERAARGTDERTYPWGDEPATCQYAVMQQGGVRGCGADSTAAGGSKPAGDSPYGAHDLAGNVWEWVSDWYGASYYASSPSSNPAGPPSGPGRVVRGGSWVSDADFTRSTMRAYYGQAESNDDVGFRCARDE